MIPEREELLRWLKPERATEEGLALAEKISPGDFEIYSERLNMIAAEAKEIFVRVGVSFMLHAGDLVVGIHTAEGDLVTACLGTFLHTVSAQLPIKWIMKNFLDNPRVGIREGDIFLCNEPNYGGIHNPDQIAMMPVFCEGEHIAWATAGVHQPETGGSEPGGFVAGARTRHDEGMKLTPIKIAENYQLKDDLVEMTINMISRAPRMQAVDLRARVAGCDRIRVRIQELVREKGRDFVKGLFHKVLQVAEQGTREKLKSWNDGTYRTVVFLETIGRKRALWRVYVTAHKENDRLALDFTGTSPENDGSWNALPQASVAFAAVYLYPYPFHDLPPSTATLAPIDWVYPKGTVYNPDPEAAVSCAVFVSEAMLKALPQIFSRMMFSTEDRWICNAPIGVSQPSSAVVGLTQWGVPFADNPAWIINHVGQGGRVEKDGTDSAFFQPCLISCAPDNEENEINLPLLVIYQQHRKDSCGHGKYRGGSGAEIGNVIYGTSHLVRPRFYNTGRIPFGQGLFGGYPSFFMPYTVIAGGNLLDLMRSGDKRIPTSTVEVVRERIAQGEYSINRENVPPDFLPEGSFYSAGAEGGCGYGDVLERDPDAAVEDVRAGIITDWAVRNVYHIAYDPETWTVDYDKTEALRHKEREDRLRRSISYEEFEKEWLKKRPDADLDYYGSWPDARPVRPIIRM